MQELKVNLLVEGLRIVIVASRFNEMIVDQLIEGASDTFRQFGGNPDELLLSRVPGAFEISTAARQFAETECRDNIKQICRKIETTRNSSQLHQHCHDIS